MKDIFREIIKTFHRSDLPMPNRRDILLPFFPKEVRKAHVFIGMRRSGKTWTLYQIMQDLIAEGVDFSKMLYINFEDDRLCDMRISNFQDLLKAYFELYPEYADRSDIHFFFDEIHEVDGWEKFVRRLLDQGHMKIYITGSSSKMLSKEIASSLRGRTFDQEIFPFSFTEVLKRKNISVSQSMAEPAHTELVYHLRNFLAQGGFPEVIDTSAETHRTVLQSYSATVMYRDIVDRYGIRSTHALKHLLTHCLRNSATAFSINKIYRTLKSMGCEIGKNSLYEYMDYFEDAYCVFSVGKYDLSQRKSIHGIRKIYAVDQGLITAMTLKSEFDMAAQLETAVFSHIRRQTHNVFHYRTKEGKEVDFVSLLPDQTLHLYQVSVSLKNAKTRHREIDALTSTMHELGLDSGTIITLDEEERITLPIGKISIVPVWKLLLGWQ